jgi:hypothetical protein
MHCVQDANSNAVSLPQDQYRSVLVRLKPHARRRGDYLQRVVHCLLHALDMRVQGSAFASLGKALHMTLRVRC